MRRTGTRRYDGRKLFWLHAAEFFIVLVIVLFLIFRFVLGISAVSGVSMKDTFQSGDIIFYTRVNPTISVGDIISAEVHTDEAGSTYYIKRVVAKEGDVVDLRDGVLYVNDEPEKGDYIRGKTYAEDCAFTYPYTVPEGSYFIVGDNREESVDSRAFGAVGKRQIKGVIHVRLGWLYVDFI